MKNKPLKNNMKKHFSGPQWNPAIKDLLNEFQDLRDQSDSRARKITEDVYRCETEDERTLRQAKAAATRDAYDYCIMLITDLNQKI